MIWETEKRPTPYVSVLLYMPGEKPFPTTHEGYMDDVGRWHVPLLHAMPERDEVKCWAEMPTPEENDEV